MGTAHRAWPLGLAIGSLVAASACSDETSRSAPPPGPDAGTGGEAGAPPDAGPAELPCPPGELPLDDDTCVAAGIPPDGCGEGFAPTGDRSCEPILPSEPCPAGTMAIPGETSCRPVAPCGTGTWGDIPSDGSTQFVDASYLGGDSDGTQDKPWLTVQAGVAGAAAGAVVAIAAGSYAENVVTAKPVRLWGRCPELVEIAGVTTTPAILFQPGASGAEVHDLSVTGPERGVQINGCDAVRLERLWIHDTASYGIRTQDDDGLTTGAEVVDSLVERANKRAVSLWGATVTMDRSVVRDTQPDANDQDGIGVSICDDDVTATRSDMTVRRSVIRGNRTYGLIGWASDITLEDTVVMDTLPRAADGCYGVGIRGKASSGGRSLVTLRGSLIATSHFGGVHVVDSELVMDRTVVRDTAPAADDQERGDGVLVVSLDADETVVPHGLVRASVIENNHTLGASAFSGTLTLESTIVRGTEEQAADHRFGRGVDVEESLNVSKPAHLTVVGSLLEANHDVGIIVLGATAEIDLTWVRDTQPSAAEMKHGEGICIHVAPEHLTPSEATIRRSRIEGSHVAGLLVAGAHATVEDVVVMDTRARPDTDLYGDGILVNGVMPALLDNPGSAEIRRTAVHGSARAGVSSLSATVTIGGSNLQCNTIDLDGETIFGEPFVLDDGGGNLCGCNGAIHPCQLLSSNLTPPDPSNEAPLDPTE